MTRMFLVGTVSSFEQIIGQDIPLNSFNDIQSTAT